MHWDGVACECVEYQHVESLRTSISQFAFHRKPRVAGDDLYSRARIPQIGEVAALICDFSDGWIDLVEANVVAGQPVCRNRSDSEANRPDPKRAVARIARESARMIEHNQSNRTLRTVIGSRLIPLITSRVLLAMYDLAVTQHVVMCRGVLTIH